MMYELKVKIIAAHMPVESSLVILPKLNIEIIQMILKIWFDK